MEKGILRALGLGPELRPSHRGSIKHWGTKNMFPSTSVKQNHPFKLQNHSDTAGRSEWGKGTTVNYSQSLPPSPHTTHPIKITNYIGNVSKVYTFIQLSQVVLHSQRKEVIVKIH